MVKARRGWLLLSSCVSAACATVAGVEVTRAPGEPSSDMDDPSAPPSADAGGGGQDGAREEAATFPPGLACGCEAGAACCVTAGQAPSCVARDPAACPGDALHLACSKEDGEGRSCCWNDAGPLRRTTLGPPCDGARTACLVDADCAQVGGTCMTTTCKGLVFGACEVGDGAAPFECPP